MNCGSICHKVTKIRWSLSYHYNYIWLLLSQRAPSQSGHLLSQSWPKSQPEGLIPTEHSLPQESTLSEWGLGEIPVLDASPSCHFTITSVLPSLEFNSLLETPTMVEAEGSQCTDRHKQSYRVKVIIFHAQNQRREALMLKACH